MTFKAETIPDVEKKPKSYVLFRISRHANRMPSGELTPEGKVGAYKVGEQIGKNAKVFKSYASNEKTKRTVKTAEAMSDGSGVTSPLRQMAADIYEDKRYATREVEGIQYDIMLPEFSKERDEAVRRIEKATLEGAGLYGQPDQEGKPITMIKQLPREEQEKLAKMRENNQDKGMNYLLTIPAVAHRLAAGLSSQLVDEMKIGARYLSRYESYLDGYNNEDTEKDIVLNTQTHGLFLEAVLLDAGFIKRDNGAWEGITNMEDEEVGGFFKPNEAYSLKIDTETLASLPPRPTMEDLKRVLPQNIPVVFDNLQRPQEGEVCVDRDILLSMAEEFKEWKQNRDKK